MILSRRNLSEQAFWRAKTILNRGHVKLLDSSSGQMHFSVKQRSGDWCDVWRTINDRGEIYWACNAVSDEKTSHQQIKCGCVWTHVQSEPFCSHTKACELWLRGEDL